MANEEGKTEEKTKGNVCRQGEDLRESDGNRAVERKMQRRARNRSYLHEVGRVAGWGYPPLGREFPL